MYRWHLACGRSGPIPDVCDGEGGQRRWLSSSDADASDANEPQRLRVQDTVKVLRQCAVDADHKCSQHRALQATPAAASPPPSADGPAPPAAHATTTQASAPTGAGKPVHEKSSSVRGLHSSIQIQRERLASLMQRVATLRKLASSLESTTVRSCHYLPPYSSRHMFDPCVTWAHIAIDVVQHCPTVPNVAVAMHRSSMLQYAHTVHTRICACTSRCHGVASNRRESVQLCVGLHSAESLVQEGEVGAAGKLALQGASEELDKLRALVYRTSSHPPMQAPSLALPASGGATIAAPDDSVPPTMEGVPSAEAGVSAAPQEPAAATATTSVATAAGRVEAGDTPLEKSDQKVEAPLTMECAPSAEAGVSAAPQEPAAATATTSAAAAAGRGEAGDTPMEKSDQKVEAPPTVESAPSAAACVSAAPQELAAATATTSATAAAGREEAGDTPLKKGAQTVEALDAVAQGLRLTWGESAWKAPPPAPVFHVGLTSTHLPKTIPFPRKATLDSRRSSSTDPENRRRRHMDELAAVKATPPLRATTVAASQKQGPGYRTRCPGIDPENERQRHFFGGALPVPASPPPMPSTSDRTQASTLLPRKKMAGYGARRGGDPENQRRRLSHDLGHSPSATAAPSSVTPSHQGTGEAKNSRFSMAHAGSQPAPAQQRRRSPDYSTRRAGGQEENQQRRYTKDLAQAPFGGTGGTSSTAAPRNMVHQWEGGGETAQRVGVEQSNRTIESRTIVQPRRERPYYAARRAGGEEENLRRRSADAERRTSTLGVAMDGPESESSDGSRRSIDFSSRAAQKELRSPSPRAAASRRGSTDYASRRAGGEEENLRRRSADAERRTSTLGVAMDGPESESSDGSRRSIDFSSRAARKELRSPSPRSAASQRGSADYASRRAGSEEENQRRRSDNSVRSSLAAARAPAAGASHAAILRHSSDAAYASRRTGCEDENSRQRSFSPPQPGGRTSSHRDGTEASSAPPVHKRQSSVDYPTRRAGGEEENQRRRSAGGLGASGAP
jgi:trimeric autotransporter adhesin